MIGYAAMSTSPDLPRTALSRGPCDSLTELSARYLEEYLEKIAACLQRLDDEQVWWRPSTGNNSIGNLMLHLAGNLSLWLLNGIGGQSHERHRSQEFLADHSHSKEQLLARLGGVVADSCDVLRGFPDDQLTAPRSNQGYWTNSLGMVFHAVEHMAYHTGQIVAATKQLNAGKEAIEFYPQHRGE